MHRLLQLMLLSIAAIGLFGASEGYSQSNRELVFGLHPEVLAKVAPASHEWFAGQVVNRAGVEGAVHRNKLGMFVLDLPESMTTAEAKDFAKRVRSLPGVLIARVDMGPEARRAHQKAMMFSLDPTARDVLGFIVKYHAADMALKSRANEGLPVEELSRLSTVAGLPFVSSRAMSGDAFVIDLEQPIALSSAIPLQNLLESDPALHDVSVNELVNATFVPNDPLFPQQWSLATSIAGISASAAWDITTGTGSTVVAVVDTGILPHPDIAPRLLPGYDFITDPARSNDGDGRDSNPTDAGDWVPAGYCGVGTPAKVSTWHGLHVAGIIGAQGNNAGGIAGIDWNARVLPVRVLGRCGGATADIVDGWRWAAGLPVPGVPANLHPARVINMSLGGKTRCANNPSEQRAALEILLTGAAVVVSAGNSSDEAANFSPAGCYGVLTVGAIGPNGDRAYYSNFSDLAVDISAPGGNMRDFGTTGGILSLFASGTQSDIGSPTYHFYQGTSQAAPHVSGVISLMLGANPSLTIAQINDIVIGTARPFAPGTSCATRGDCGSGIVDAGAAVKLARDLQGISWNFTDHWYFDAESGWGIQVTAEGELQFVTWYTYGEDGNPLWFVMVLTRVGQDIFAGDIYRTTGVPLPNINGSQASLTEQKVGTAVLAYFGLFEAWLYYSLPDYEAARPLSRLRFAQPFTLCYYTTQSRATSVNYQDMWWTPVESGWGLNITHQGDTIFATWFTYGPQGQPLWLYLIAGKTGPNTYAGRLFQTKGIPYNLINFSQSYTQEFDVGFGSLTFESGERARFDYTAYGFKGSKMIERQVFASPVTNCQPLQ